LWTEQLVKAQVGKRHAGFCGNERNACPRRILVC
jgi:hypothetical protein